jgi:hypothetical protein
VILGDLDPILHFSKSGSATDINLKNVAKGSSFTGSPCYPAGQRMKSAPTSEVRWSYVPLMQLLDNGHEPRGSPTRVTLKNYVNKSVPIEGNLNNYGIAYAWDGNPIKPAFGGPLVGVWLDKPKECLSFVSELEVMP